MHSLLRCAATLCTMYACFCVIEYEETYVHTHVHTHTHTCIRTHVHTHTHTCIHTHTHTHMRTHTHMHTHAHTCTHTHTHTHTCTHTHTHTNTHTQVLSRSGSEEQQHHFIDLLGLNVDGGLTSGVDGVIRGNEKNCCRLRGLPWSGTPEDVISFFGEIGGDIAPQGVHMVLNAMVREDEDLVHE